MICVSTFLPTKDFYYPGRLYEGIQIYIDRNYVKEAGKDFLFELGVNTEQIAEVFCGKDGLYLHRMNDSLLELVREVWEICLLYTSPSPRD